MRGIARENMSCRGRRLCRPFSIAGSGRTESSAPTTFLGNASCRGRAPAAVRNVHPFCRAGPACPAAHRCGTAAACGASPGRICPVGAGDSAGPFLLPVPGGQSRPPLRNCWGILCGASGTPHPTECAAGGVGAKKPDAFASGFLIHSLLRIRLFGSLPSLTCPWGRRSGGRSCCRTRCRRRSRSWRRRIPPQARPPGRSPSSWRPPAGRSSPWRR